MKIEAQIWEELAQILAPAKYRELMEWEISAVREKWGEMRTLFNIDDNLEAQGRFLSKFKTLSNISRLELIGHVQWYIYSEFLNNIWDGPMNGQRGRQAMFREIIEAARFKAIVETGAFRGDTTKFMAETAKLPVYTTESCIRDFAYAKNRLQRLDGVFIANEDSRSFLGRLAADPFFPKDHTLFYLDSHGDKDLPLREEFTIIAHNWSDFVVMVDDFQVPDDGGYAYDDYGNGNKLCLEYLLYEEFPSLKVYWPSLPSTEETGSRRGCVVLASDGVLENTGRPLISLRSP